MKRRITLILLLLLGGAIMNIAVAWGLFYQSPAGNYASQISEYHYALRTAPWQIAAAENIDRFELRMSKRFGEVSLELSDARWQSRSRPPQDLRQTIFLSTMPQMSRLRNPNADMEWISLEYDRFVHERLIGLPFLTVNVVEHGRGQSLSSVVFESTFAIKLIWPGFAINTIFYAAILWMIFAFPFVVRRHVRGRRGLCPACAYPIGTSDVCTECGAAVKH